jgi:hypothetical protein
MIAKYYSYEQMLSRLKHLLGSVSTNTATSTVAERAAG